MNSSLEKTGGKFVNLFLPKNKQKQISLSFNTTPYFYPREFFQNLVKHANYVQILIYCCFDSFCFCAIEESLIWLVTNLLGLCYCAIFRFVHRWPFLCWKEIFKRDPIHFFSNTTLYNYVQLANCNTRASRISFVIHHVHCTIFIC